MLVKAQPLRRLSKGSGKADRTAAWCWAGKVQVNCAMVRGAWALRWAQHDRHGRLCESSGAVVGIIYGKLLGDHR